MLTSRRTLLRSAALMPLSGALAAKPLSLLAAEPPRRAGAQIKHPASFASGVRIFFSGSWLFTTDGNGGVLAVTHDLCGMPHAFPCGPWKNGGFAPSNPSLGANPSQSYVVSVSGYKAGPTNVDLLFASAQSNAPFTYLKNSGRSLKVDTSGKDVRVVQVPMPTNLIACAFLSSATLKSPLASLSTDPNSTGISGVATTHIFEYQDQSSTQKAQLSFGADAVSSATDSSGDYHFHTAPKTMALFNHGPYMFFSLLGLITGGAAPVQDQMGLYDPSDGKYSLGGANVPTLSNGELGLPSNWQGANAMPGARKAMPPNGGLIMDQELASCAGGGIGLGDGN